MSKLVTMTTLILAILLAAPLQAAPVSTTTCIRPTYRDSTLCTMPDGSGVLTDFDGSGGFTTSRYSAEDWARLSTAILQTDADKVAARLAQLKAVSEQAAKDEAALNARFASMHRASAITHKKPCLAAGFAWKSGTCWPETTP